MIGEKKLRYARAVNDLRTAVRSRDRDVKKIDDLLALVNVLGSYFHVLTVIECDNLLAAYVTSCDRRVSQEIMGAGAAYLYDRIYRLFNVQQKEWRTVKDRTAAPTWPD